MNAHEAHKELGTRPGDTADQIKAAFRSRSKVTHPDKGGSDAAFKRTVEAYNLLSRGASASPTGRTAATGTGPQAKQHASKPKAAVADSREDWMLNAYAEILQHGRMAGMTIPPIRLSCGYGRGGRRKVWSVIEPTETADGIPQAFISPELSAESKVLDAMVQAIAKAMGADGATLLALWKLAKPHVEAAAGPYPHAAVNGAKAVQTQSTRLLKATCPDCGYVIRVAKKWADCGLPECSQCAVQFEVA